MNWKQPTNQEAWEGFLALLGLAIFGFKKELVDWLKYSWKGGYKSLHNWSQRRNFVVQLTEKQLKEMTSSSFDATEASLYLLMGEYDAQRVTIMEYEAQDGGGALATCLVQARANDMPSVRDYQKTPISPELFHEILNIEQLHHRLRYVSDARVQDVAALRAAMLKLGALSAYYQIISQPMQRPIRLLAFSWQRSRELTPTQLSWLRISGIMCSTALSNLDKLKVTSND